MNPLELPETGPQQSCKIPGWRAEGPHIYAPPASGRGLLRGLAFVSCLFLVGTTDARNQSNRGRKRVGSLTLSV